MASWSLDHEALLKSSACLGFNTSSFQDLVCVCACMNVCIYTCVYSCTLSQRSISGFVPQEPSPYFLRQGLISLELMAPAEKTAVSSRDHLLLLQRRGTSVCCHIRFSIWVLGTYLWFFAGVHGALLCVLFAGFPHGIDAVIISKPGREGKHWKRLEVCSGVCGPGDG